MLYISLLVILPGALALTCGNIPPPIYGGTTPFKYCLFANGDTTFLCGYQAIDGDSACTYNAITGRFGGRIAFYPRDGTYGRDPSYGADICPGSVNFFEGTPSAGIVCTEAPYSATYCLLADTLKGACDATSATTAVLGGICAAVEQVDTKAAVLAGIGFVASLISAAAKGDYSDFRDSTGLQVTGLGVARFAGRIIALLPQARAALTAVYYACQFRKIADTVFQVDLFCNSASAAVDLQIGDDYDKKCPKKRAVSGAFASVSASTLQLRQTLPSEDPNYNVCTEALAILTPVCDVPDLSDTCANKLAVIKDTSLPGSTALTDLAYGLETLCSDIDPIKAAQDTLQCDSLVSALREFEPFCTRATIDEIVKAYNERDGSTAPPPTPSKRAMKRDVDPLKSNYENEASELKCVAPLVPCAPFGEIDTWTCINLQTSIDSCGECHTPCELEGAFSVDCVAGICVARNFTRTFRPAPVHDHPRHDTKKMIATILQWMRDAVTGYVGFS